MAVAVCPNCGSEDVDWAMDSETSPMDNVKEFSVCQECPAQWTTVYKYESIKGLEVDDS